jgi:hypothetical protein
MDPHLRKIAHRLVDELVDARIVSPTGSPYNSRAVLVKKKEEDEYRLCIDFRDLNRITKPLSFNLPLLEDLTDTLYGNIIFSTIDMKAGYYSVELSEKSKHYTAFQVEGRPRYAFNKTPMGLKNASAAFLRMMGIMLGDSLYDTCVAFTDDIIIASKNPEQHLKDVREIFQKLRKAGIKANPKKCRFGKKQVTFLGYVVTKDGISPDKRKTKLVDEAVSPTKCEGGPILGHHVAQEGDLFLTKSTLFGVSFYASFP